MNETIHANELGPVYEKGFGLAFQKYMTDPELSVNEKYVLCIYGFYASLDGTRKCEESQTFLEEFSGMRRADFYKARQALQKKGLMSVTLTTKASEDIAGRKYFSHSIVSVSIPDRKYGLLPRVLVTDEKLSIKEKVAAAYLYAVTGRIGEYLLSGYAMRKNLSDSGRPLSNYAFCKMMKSLKDYFAIKPLKEKEILAAGIVPSEDGFLSDYYRVTKIGVFGQETAPWKEKETAEAEEKASETPQNTSEYETFETEDDSREPASFEIATTENVTTENVTTENVTTENAPEENAPANKEPFAGEELLFRESPLADESPLPVNPYGRERKKSQKAVSSFDQSKRKTPEKCPPEIRERLGLGTAVSKIESLHMFHGLPKEERDRYLKLAGDIVDSLYEIALRDRELEPYALARNFASLLTHRIIEDGNEVRNLAAYVTAAVKKSAAGEDRCVYKAPVLSECEGLAYVDGYRISDGKSAVPLLYSSIKLTDEEYRFQEKEFTAALVEWQILPAFLLNDHRAYIALRDMLRNDVTNEEMNALTERYEEDDVARTLDAVSDAFLRLLVVSEDAKAGNTALAIKSVLKWLSGALEIKSGSLHTKNRLFAKVASLYLSSSVQRKILSEDKWLRTTLHREIAFYSKDQDNGTLLEPIPVVSRGRRENRSRKQN